MDCSSGTAEVSDAHLISQVRAGDTDAFGELYRRHVNAARMVALRHTDNPSDADDMVADAFSATLDYLRQGKGPDNFFRAYVLTAVTRLSHRRNERASRVRATDNDLVLDQRFEDEDTLERSFETSMVSDSYWSLPERWRSVLWYLEVEGMKPAQAAPLLGLSPNAVSALAIRAKEGLRRSYLESHRQATGSEECAEFSRNVGAFGKKGLGREQRRQLEGHAAGCLKCAALFTHLSDVQAGLRGVLFPLVAGIPFIRFESTAVGALATAKAAVKSSLSTPAGAVGAAVAGAAVAALLSGGIIQALVPEPAPVTQGPLPTSNMPSTVPTPSVTTPPPPAESPPVTPSPTAVPSALTGPAPQVSLPAPVPVPVTPVPAPAPVEKPPVQNTVFPSSSVISRDPGTGSMSVYVDFMVLGEEPLSEATVAFSLQGGSTFGSTPAAPAGWVCSGFSPGSVSMTCSTGSAVRGELSFTLTTVAEDQAQRGSLTYGISGQGMQAAQGNRVL